MYLADDVKPEEVHIADTQDLESEIVDKSLQTPKSVPMIEKTDELPQCTKVTDVLRDSNKTFMLKPSKIRNSSLNISADSEKESEFFMSGL